MSYMRQVREPRFHLSSLAQYVMPVLALLIFGTSPDYIWKLVALIAVTSALLSYVYTRLEWGTVGIVLITVVSALIAAVCVIPAFMFGLGALFGDFSMSPLPLSLIIVNIPFAVFLIFMRYSLS